MVLDLAGKVVEFFPIGRVNNVDLRSSWSMGGENNVLVAASDQYFAYTGALPKSNR